MYLLVLHGFEATNLVYSLSLNIGWAVKRIFFYLELDASIICFTSESKLLSSDNVGQRCNSTDRFNLNNRGHLLVEGGQIENDVKKPYTFEPEWNQHLKVVNTVWLRHWRQSIVHLQWSLSKERPNLLVENKVIHFCCHTHCMSPVKFLHLVYF